MRLARLSFVLGLLATVARAQPPPKPSDEVPAADVARWLGFFDKLVEVVVTDEKDCDKMATDVSLVIDQNRRAIDVARATRDTRKKLPLYAQQHMMDGVKKMAPGIQNCGSKDNVKAAFSKLDVSR
jgi:hypothetical protein